MLLLCAESSEALLCVAVFTDSACFLVAQVAEAGLENSINIILSYLPVTSGFKQIKIFIWVMCRGKVQPAVEARAEDGIYLDCSPQCQPSMPLTSVSLFSLLADGLSTVMVRTNSFCQVNSLALPACDLSCSQLQCWALFSTGLDAPLQHPGL